MACALAQVLLAIAASVDELHGIDLDAHPALAQAWLGSHGRTARLIKGSVYELPYETAEFDLARTQRDQLLAVVRLYRALGGGWNTYEETPRVPLPIAP